MIDASLVTITLPRAEWEALLALEDYSKETYTDEGAALFNAFRAIRAAAIEVKPPET